MNRLLLAAAALVVAGCKSSPTQAIGEPKHATLSIGPATTVNGLFVQLIAVENDSRCPINALCIAAGDADVRLGIYSGQLDVVISDVLHLNREPRSVVRYGYEFRLDSLKPYPLTTNPPIAQADYRAYISVRSMPD